ncbi:MAG: hypothetical protein ABSG95_01815 [Solirubrobacteraceae bacterium]|jgi:hypothetical protein
MPRIIITTTTGVGSDGSGSAFILDERVSTDHLNDDRSSLRLLERICWAIEDAEEREVDDARREVAAVG